MEIETLCDIINVITVFPPTLFLFNASLLTPNVLNGRLQQVYSYLLNKNINRISIVFCGGKISTPPHLLSMGCTYFFTAVYMFHTFPRTLCYQVLLTF